MASIPSKGDRLTAKVAFTPYTDKECIKEYPPVLPGPNGLRESVQFPAFRNAGDEVGYYTGTSSDKGYEVEIVLKYKVAQQQLFWNWVNVDVIKMAVVWVKKEQVTGFWDKGVDAPQALQVAPPPPTTDSTNTFLLIAVGAALFLKFVAPKLKGNGKN